MASTAAPAGATTFRIDQLRLSPHNVRLHRPDAEATDALEASILAEGRLLEPILVHPMRGHKGQFGVFAGGRRYRSIRKLVDRGALPADWPIAAMLHEADDVELVARSLDENLMRRELRTYETCRALAREVKLGRTPEEVARRHGQELIWVKRSLRLAALAPALFDALAEEAISLAQAQAYAATADHALQLAAYGAMSARSESLRKPEHIRAWLKVDDAEAAKLLRYVGEAAYQGAGGAFEPDLFADGEDASGRVTDDQLLRVLADRKTEALRVEARALRAARPALPASTAGRSVWGGGPRASDPPSRRGGGATAG